MAKTKASKLSNKNTVFFKNKIIINEKNWLDYDNADLINRPENYKKLLTRSPKKRNKI